MRKGRNGFRTRRGVDMPEIYEDVQGMETKVYVNGIEAVNGVVEVLYMEHGRGILTGGELERYEYFLKDHLGNNRVLFTDKDGNGKIDNTPTSEEVLEVYSYYPFGMLMEGMDDLPPLEDVYQPYKYNGKESLSANVYDYGARIYMPGIGRWNAVDPLASNYAAISPFAYVANNPLKYIDPDGQYIVPAEFAQKYKMITSYLQKHVANDVMNSPIILKALAKNTAADSPIGVGNLSIDKVREAVTWGSGPTIIAKDSPGGLSGADGFYNSTTGQIQLSTARLDHLEEVLKSDASDFDKLKALLPLYMTLLHETVHYGDYLDGLRQDGGEPGIQFEDDVWLSRKVEADGQTIDVIYFFETSKYDPESTQKIIDEKRNENVFPTPPKYIHK